VVGKGIDLVSRGNVRKEHTSSVFFCRGETIILTFPACAPPGGYETNSGVRTISWGEKGGVIFIPFLVAPLVRECVAKRLIGGLR